MRLPDLIGKRYWPYSDAHTCWNEIVDVRTVISEVMSHHLVVIEARILCDGREVNGRAEYVQAWTSAQALHKRNRVEIRVSTDAIGEESSPEVRWSFTLPPHEKVIQCVCDGLRLALMAKHAEDDTVEAELGAVVAETIERGLFESVSVSNI
jgi:hypothetical protein